MVNPEKAAFFPYFFKTGKGEYGEGDQFLGITVPEQRHIAKKYITLARLEDIAALLESPIHEHRLTALLILVGKYMKGSEEEKTELFHFYLAHTKGVNNWDLVDSSARIIVGEYLLGHSSDPQKTPALLLEMCTSPVLWERRIAIIATFAWIKKGVVHPTFDIVLQLLQDPHDLIHKACGWMLREAGKKDREALIDFLVLHKKSMPRTMLRYAIERMDQETKKEMMKR